MNKILFLLLLVPMITHALEVDEKLTVRIVKTSESRKTVMVNRGTEDGLVEGDHAKFIVTAGIVARGVCVKVSPTRSVWSIYRLVNADFIVNDSVMSIKITPAVKITKDETKPLVDEDVPSTPAGDATSLGIPLADGAQDITNAEEKLNEGEMKALEASNVPVSIVERNVEAYTFLNISGLTANTKPNTGKDSFNSSQMFYHIGLGGEYYPRREREWYSKFSLLGELNLMRENSQAYQGAAVTNELTEFSFGTNWHFTTLPSVTGEFIPYLHFAFNIGTVKSTYKDGTNTSTQADTLSANGGTSGFSVGIGAKFYTHKGLGARLLFDYYMRSEKYKEDEQKLTMNKKVGGPRLMVGLSYRF